MSATYHAQFVISGTDRLSGIFNRITAATGGAARGMASLGRAMDGMSIKSSMTEYALRRLRVGGILAVTAAFYGFAKGGIQFETALADIRSITGMTSEEVNTLANEIDRLSATYGVGKSTLSKVYQDIASKKSEYLRDTKSLTRMTEAVMLLTRASVGMDEQLATDTLTNSLNQFDLAADQSERIVHSLAMGAILGSSLIPQIGEALIETGSVAKLLNMSFEETNATLQVLGQKGTLYGSRAGRMLRNLLVNMSMYGLNIGEVGFTKALKVLNELNLSVEERGALFGKENIVAGNALMGNVDLVEKWTKEVTGTQAATWQMGLRMDTVAFKAKRTGAYISNYLIKAWSYFSDRVVEPSLEKILRFADGLDRTDAGMSRLNDTLGNVSAVLTVGVALGAALALMKVVTILWSLGESFVIGAMYVSAYGAALVAAFIAPLALIKTFYDEIDAFFYNATPKVIAFGKDLWNGFVSPIQYVLDLLNKIFGTKWSLQIQNQKQITSVTSPEIEEFWKKYGANADARGFKEWMDTKDIMAGRNALTTANALDNRGSTNTTTAVGVTNAANAFAVNTTQKLEVDLKVDGPASVKNVRSDGDILFTGDMGMLPAGAY